MRVEATVIFEVEEADTEEEAIALIKELENTELKSGIKMVDIGVDIWPYGP